MDAPIREKMLRFQMSVPAEEQKHVIRSDKLGLDYTVWVQDDASGSSKCYVLTIHDIGCSHSVFTEFVSQPEMRALKQRIVWVHVDLPGQEDDASPLALEKYPSLDEIASELINIVDRLNIPQAVIFGEGAGANIACRFAIEYPSRVHGLVLVHPTGTTAGFMEMMKDKLNNWKLIHKGMNPDAEAYLIWHRFGRDAVKSSDDSNKSKGYGDSQLLEANIREFSEKLYQKRTAKNLALFMDAFLNRTSLVDKLDKLSVDCLVAVGKKSSVLHTTEKFYDRLRESRNNPQKMVNSPLLIADNVGDVLGEAPDVLAKSMQFFLQGIGLLSGLPMEAGLVGLGRLSRAMSMEDADRPRRSSVLTSSPGTASPAVIGSPPKFPS
jgi:protein NDRG1